MLTVAVNICRILLAACFIFSGFVKAVDPVGTQIKLQDYLLAFGWENLFSSDLLLSAGILAGVEFFLGIYLLLGVFRYGTSLILMVVMLFFTPFTLYLAIKNPVSDCGCFGDALILTNWQTFAKNVVLLLLAVFVFIFKTRIVPFVSERRAWVVPVITATLIINFMLSNIRDLPIFDFRPYRVGTDLRSEILEGKDGRFDEFYLMDSEYNDATEKVLSADGYSFLIVSPHLEEASQNNIDLINDLYYYSRDAGYPIYGITASGNETVKAWSENTYAQYEFLFADEIVLKTMIRRNPGVLVLKDGAIVAKWSDRNIPLDSQVSARMEQLKPARPEWSSAGTKKLVVALLFILPYLLLILIDRIGCSLQNDGLVKRE